MAYGIVSTQGVVGGDDGNSSIYLADVSNVSVTAGQGTVSIKWTDPVDVVINGVTLAEWYGTIIVRKVGSAPTSRTDGDIVLTSTSRNTYATTPWVDTELTNGTTYYYRFFPYSSEGNYTNSVSVSGKPAEHILDVPTISGTYTYDGTEKTPTLTGFDGESMVKSGDISATNAGDYEITVRITDNNSIWADGTYDDKVISWKIDPEEVDEPTVTGTLTYTGESQSPTLDGYDNSTMNLSEDVSGINAGNYTITVTLSSTNQIFKNSSSRSVDLPWIIGKATGSVVLSSNSSTLSSSKSSDTATITRVGDGALTTESTNASLITGSINGDILTVTKVGNTNGTATITVRAAETANYTAAFAQIVVTIKAYRVMTVIIDQTNSNPETCCTYADDAVGMTAGSTEWDEWFGYYPVMLNAGVEGKKLNPADYSVYTDGTSADLTSGAEGDVMVAYPRMGVKITTDANDKITVSMTDNPNAGGFSYLAHTRGSELKDKFYLGVYKGYNKDNKLRSLKGYTPTGNITIGSARTLARANTPASDGSGGSGYDQSGWYQMIFRQAMYVLKYKNLNSQATVGQGVTSGSVLATGGTESWGLQGGTQANTTTHVKCFGIEDMWGNVWEWIDGLVIDSSLNVFTATQGFNDAGSEYSQKGNVAARIDWGNYTKRVQGTSDLGFLIKEEGGSETTYFCDLGAVATSCVPSFGGSCGSDGNAGVFALHVHTTVVFSGSFDGGARLMWL